MAKFIYKKEGKLGYHKISLLYRGLRDDACKVFVRRVLFVFTLIIGGKNC